VFRAIWQVPRKVLFHLSGGWTIGRGDLVEVDVVARDRENAGVRLETHDGSEAGRHPDPISQECVSAKFARR
jgi:hypothetical protein